MEIFSASKLRDELSSLGIEIYAENGRLRVNAPKGALTEKLQDAVSAKKAQLLELLEVEQPPLTRTESRLAGIWKNILGLDKVDKNDDFFELGGHSLLALRMMAMVEAEFGCRINLEALFESPTIESFALAIESADECQVDFRKIVSLHPSSTRPRVFGINSTGAYYLLAKQLGPEWPLTALQLFDPSYPVEKMPESMEQIAAQYVQLIQQLQPKGPYNLLSWCVGGILMMEVAQQLLAANEEVSFLGIIEGYAPFQYERFNWLRSKLALNSYRIQWNLAEFNKVRSGELSLRKFLIDRRTFRTEFWSKLFRVSEPEEATYGFWLMVSYLSSVAKKYQLKTLPVKIHLFRGSKMPRGLFLDELNGWGRYATKGVQVSFIEGDHNSVFRPPGIDQLAKEISAALIGAKAHIGQAMIPSLAPTDKLHE
jgi:thioesterase domain-containing protein/acyl carrier protein